MKILTGDTSKGVFDLTLNVFNWKYRVIHEWNMKHRLIFEINT